MLNHEELLSLLKPHGQEHLLKFWPELSQEEQAWLSNELEHLNVEQVCGYFHKAINERKAHTQTQTAQEAFRMEPIADECKGSAEKATEQEVKEYTSRGFEAIANNQVGVLLMAGGQGTRLGVTYPKGMYSVDLPSQKTLFQIQAERLLKIKELAKSYVAKDKDNNKEENNKEEPTKQEKEKEEVRVPWYIMVSQQTLQLTKDFFVKHNYFGLPSRDVVFFVQGTLPCFTPSGQIILDRKYKIARAPDGNGGLYRALDKEGILDDLARRGVQHLHVYCVDNVLVKMCDPVFTGFALNKQANCASKVVRKTEPDEKVGVICKVNGAYQVVEYSEISEKTRNQRNGDHHDAELTFNAGNICNHFLSVEFLNALCQSHEHELKHHIAEKKIPHVDMQDGLLRKPTTNNGIKLEKFIFDIFPFSTAQWSAPSDSTSTFAVWEVQREEEFSPLKNSNAATTDNPTTCRNDLMEQHYRWLQAAGCHLEPSEDNIDNGGAFVNPQIEISPLVVSHDGQISHELKQQLSGKVFREPLRIEFDQKLNEMTFNGLTLQAYYSEKNQ